MSQCRAEVLLCRRTQGTTCPWQYATVPPIFMMLAGIVMTQDVGGFDMNSSRFLAYLIGVLVPFQLRTRKDQRCHRGHRRGYPRLGLLDGLEGAQT